MYRSATIHSENRTFEISASGIAWSRDRSYCRRRIFRCSVLQLYCTSYAVRSAFSATATLLVCYCSPVTWPFHSNNTMSAAIFSSFIFILLLFVTFIDVFDVSWSHRVIRLLINNYVYTQGRFWVGQGAAAPLLPPIQKSAPCGPQMSNGCIVQCYY